jgi:uncharacterized protein YrrD
LAVDKSGNAYTSGYTTVPTFPQRPFSPQCSNCRGCEENKPEPTWSLLYCQRGEEVGIANALAADEEMLIMLRKAKDLNGYKLGARDGDIGKVKEFYFDDRHWTIRYLVADTGDWMSGRRVLISPYALDPARKEDQVIPVDLTKKQIENSPPLESDKPVSRQYEMQYYPYYGWPVYWGGPYMWGATAYPQRGIAPPSASHSAPETDDPHLRSTASVTGHDIQAKDGEIGHVDDFVIDDETWSIRYLIVDTSNWWMGKKVLLSTRWIDNISWDESKVFMTGLTREAIKQAPEFSDETLITRDYETKLHRYHNREEYWADELAGKSTR